MRQVTRLSPTTHSCKPWIRKRSCLSPRTQGQGENSLILHAIPQRPLSLGVSSPELEWQALGRGRESLAELSLIRG